MRTYPVEFRERVLALTDEGMGTGEVADVLGVSASWVRSIKRLRAAGRPLAPKSRANRRTSLARREGARIRARVAEHPGTTLADLRRHLGLATSIANLWNAVRQLGLSLKKKRPAPPSGGGPTSKSSGPPGTSSGPASTRGGSSSSTRRSAPPR
jgi:transposase